MSSESRPPSDDEMNTYGGMLAASTFGISILNASLLVVQIVLVLYGISGFFATPRERRKGRLRLIIISSLMVVMCTIDISFDSWKYFLILYTGGPDGVSYLQALTSLYESENWRWDPIGDAFLFTATAIGDILMASPISFISDRKWVVVLPSLACIGSIASKIAYLVGIVSSNSDLSNKMLVAGAALHVAMNIMITFLIVFRVMKARSRSVKAFPGQEPPRWYSDVTATVVESAAPLAIFGIVFITLSGTIVSESARQLEPGQLLRSGRLNIVTDVAGCFYDAFSILSPQMIIVRVTRARLGVVRG
ncbi:hypothetical protein BKA70DRAFT_1423620 [Coprinopsis sp. MPI-PUGE-AT-0042]|nr:hypothetical protein BKA70DRAFT_1423620 [Coprinopsis sp. MPI-PUGE-AT-0042]